MHRSAIHRLLALILATALLATSGVQALAQSSASTGVTIEFTDAGTFEVAWAGTASPFLVNGEAPSISASSPTVRATSTYTVQVTDTRPDDSRSAYTVSLRASAFTAAGTDRQIDPSALSIAGIDGLPDGMSGATAIGASLDTPVTILSAPAGSSAITASITLTLAMVIGPGVPAGEYSGSLVLEILPISGP